MRIGQFSEKFNVSIDTVRFYVENGLILPEMVHNQRIFDHQCEKDMELVLTLKKMRFSLAEIKKMISLIRMTNMIDQSDKAYYGHFFEKKKEELSREKQEIDQALQLIDVQLSWSTMEMEDSPSKIGIPITFFSHFCCPSCELPLQLDHAKVENNQIHEGTLTCACGYAANIEDGILKTSTATFEDHTNGQRLSQEYMDSFDADFLNFAMKPLEWVTKRMDFRLTKHATLLELGTGMGSFLGRIMDKIQLPCTYIATDQNYSILCGLKQAMEKHWPRPDLILIASDFTKLPLRKASMDFIFDIYGTFSHMFSHKDYPIFSVRDLMKDKSLWYGTYMYFEPHAHGFLDPYAKQAPYFDLRQIKSTFQGFEKVDAAKLGSCDSLGDLRNRMKPGTVSYAWACCARRIRS